MEAAAGGGLLDFEEEVFVVPVAPAPTQHRADVAVDRFDFPEGDLLVAVVQDAVQMARQHSAELLGGRPPPPAGTEGLPLLPVQVHPAAQREPALAPDEPAGLGPLPEELRSAGLIHRLTGMAQDVGLVIDDPGVGGGLRPAGAGGGA